MLFRVADCAIYNRARCQDCSVSTPPPGSLPALSVLHPRGTEHMRAGCALGQCVPDGSSGLRHLGPEEAVSVFRGQ